ncbi:hypothetical protein [Streptomyces sp. NPDC016845]|uniref:hypothetical protein n=1 Tax=Streptomyces sp. NPDC016845 TaxID=3364972 RepID=UPI00379D4892
MRRGLVHSVAWLLATGAAVTLSWWGVHTVMSGTAYDPPRALPVVAADASDSALPVSSSTRRPEPSSPSATSARPSAKPSADPSPKPSASRSTPPSPSSPPATASSSPPGTASSGNVKSYETAGGRAVFDLGDTSATLVSATPSSGWSVQVWKQTTWIRVEFTSGEQRVSAFCTWHDHRPSVEIATY